MNPARGVSLVLAITGLACAVLCGAAAVAGPLEDGVAAFDRQDFDESLRLLGPLAEKGVAQAQFKLGFMYFSGAGVSKDEEQGMAWNRKAIAQNYAPAKDWLLLICMDSAAAPARDCDSIFAEVKAKAQAGDPSAEARLGSFYLLGRGGATKDPVQGVDWLRKAAEKGLGRAQTQLGLIYSTNSMGVRKDQARSLAWFRKAAAQGEVAAMDALAMHYATGVDPAPDSKAQAVDWYERAASTGDIVAEASLGRMYEEGDGVAKDPAKAIHWYRALAEKGDGDAQAKVGAAYALGKGVPRDDVQAYAWLDLSMIQGASGGVSDIDGAKRALTTLARQLTPAQIAEAKALAASMRAKQDGK